MFLFSKRPDVLQVHSIQFAQGRFAGGLSVDVPAFSQLDLYLGEDPFGCLLVRPDLAAFVPPFKVAEGYPPVMNCSEALQCMRLVAMRLFRASLEILR